MKCEKCGELILDGDSFCTNCGTKVTNLPVPSTTQQPLTYQQAYIPTPTPTPEEENAAANKLCIFSLLSYFAAPIVFLLLDIILSLVLQTSTFVFTAFSSVARVAGIVLMIIARVKYPKNTFAKVLMWLYIGLAILAVLLIIILIFIICFAIAGVAMGV